MHVDLVQSIVPYASGGMPRTAGVHVSGLIRGKAAQTGILSRKWVDPEDISLVEVVGDGARWWQTLDRDSQVRMAIGMAWEQWYLPQLQGVTYQPGERCVEGVYMTIDGESLDTIITVRNTQKVVLAVHEVKTTSKSINTVANLTDPIKNWMWLTQTKAYCKACKSRVCYLHVLFLYGDYSYPMRPQLLVWRIEYEQWEIDEAWQLLLDYLHQQRHLQVGREWSSRLRSLRQAS